MQEYAVVRYRSAAFAQFSSYVSPLEFSPADVDRECDKRICFMETLDVIREKIRFYDGFPKEGIVFIDLLPLLNDAAVFREVEREIALRISCGNVAVPEARGFIFASPLLTVDSGVDTLIAFRKSGKLPHVDGDLVEIPVMKEYGGDSLCFRKSDVAACRTVGADSVIEITVFDDVLATGGTAEGMAIALNALSVGTVDGNIPVRVREFVFLAEITSIGARDRLERIAPVKSVLQF